MFGHLIPPNPYDFIEFPEEQKSFSIPNYFNGIGFCPYSSLMPVHSMEPFHTEYASQLPSAHLYPFPQTSNQFSEYQHIETLTQPITTFNNLFYSGSILDFTVFINGIDDISKLKEFYKPLEQQPQIDPSNEKIVILLKRITEIYLVPKWSSMSKKEIVTPNSWAKALKYALKTRQLDFVDSIWQLYPDWKIHFCQFERASLKRVNIFLTSVKTRHTEINEMIWNLNTKIFQLYIDSLPTDYQKDILLSVMYYGSPSLTEQYVKSVNNINILTASAQHARKHSWNIENILIVEKRIIELKTKMRSYIPRNKESLSSLDIWITSLHSAFYKGKSVDINTIWKSKPQTWRNYFYGLPVSIKGNRIQIKPQKCYQHFLYTLSTRGNPHADKFWEISHDTLKQYILLELKEDQQRDLLKKIVENASKNLFLEFLQILEAGNKHNIVQECLIKCESSTDMHTQGRLKYLRNIVDTAPPSITVHHSSQANNDPAQFQSAPLEPLFDLSETSEINYQIPPCYALNRELFFNNQSTPPPATDSNRDNLRKRSFDQTMRR